MFNGMQRAAAALPVVSGNNQAPAAAAAARSPASQTLAVTSQVPADHPAVSYACVPATNASAALSHGGKGGGARGDDPMQSEKEDIVSSFSINSSRGNADNARCQLSGQHGFEGFDKSGPQWGEFRVI